MRLLAPLLLPLALCAPTNPSRSLPELSVSQWSAIQSGVFHRISSLTSWSWSKAEEVVHDIEADLGIPTTLNRDGNDESKTIWEQLKDDPNSFSRLVKILEFEGKACKYLDDKDLSITFFAPNNDALKPPEHHHDHDHDGDHDHDDDGDEDDAVLAELTSSPSLAILSSALEREPTLLLKEQDSDSDSDSSDDDKKKRRKEILRKIAGYILQYHGLTEAYTARELATNSTFPTALKAHDGSYGGLHRRIKVEKSLVPPSLKLNGYAKVLVSDRKASNGYFHTLNHPLLPPPSILDELFLFPDFFSTLTSAVQQVHKAWALDWSYDRNKSKSEGKPHFHGVPLATAFTPSNAAFHLLPLKLKIYLFSPYGRGALIKLLAYHYVPETLLLTEFFYSEHKHHHHGPEHFDFGMAGSDDDPSFHKEFDIHTGLHNATIKVEIDKTKFLPVEGAVKITLKANGQIAEAIDIPARNGAWHVLNKVLVPPHHHHGHHDHDEHHAAAHIVSDDCWDSWEEWFPAWAENAQA
ncbi:hypothetical protein JCM24511_08498 [Saitozyma sp. JCM 24511]|nr:hypothetical protein JCM24511_08498 [Saitozyma sp. JCM 24511]